LAFSKSLGQACSQSGAGIACRLLQQQQQQLLQLQLASMLAKQLHFLWHRFPQRCKVEELRSFLSIRVGIDTFLCNAQECCGYVDGEQIAAATVRIFNRYADKHGYIPDDKVPEAGKAVMWAHGGEILGVSYTLHEAATPVGCAVGLLL
jgi:hypothetical protein